MRSAVTCPPPDLLRRLLLGELTSPDGEALVQHLERCDRCVSVVRTLPAHDTLSDAVRGGETPLDGPENAEVRGLIARLRGLGCPSAEVTTPETGAEPRTPEHEDDTLDFLAPARGTGEIGWLGNYRVLRVLGSGGMGVVLEAEDVKLRRRVALKVMKRGLAKNESARKRFIREAQTTAAVKSDHVITIHQVDEADGVPFLAMEFLEGTAMDAWLKQGKRPNVAQVLRIGYQAASGLAAAHEKGLIHRDVKPANIWLESPAGRVKILDFGLARPAREDVQLTQEGAIVGTPAYMAPEQARGETVDHRCDLFSLGCVLYRLTTGRLPFSGETTMAVLMSLATETPKPVRELNPNLPPRLADLIPRLLAKDPAERPASAKAVIAEIQAIQRDLAKPATPTLPHAKPVPPRRRSRWPIAVALGLASVAAAIVLAIVLSLRTPDGEVIIELADGVDAKDVKIEVQGNGALKVTDAANGWTIDVKEGKYSVQLAGGQDKLQLDRDTVTVQRGEKTRVKVSLRPAVAANNPPGADKEKPFVLVRKDGGREEFKHLAEAQVALAEGDTVEVHGNGPFMIPALKFDKGLVMTAARGYRPRFRPGEPLNEAHSAWFGVTGPTQVEGCDFEWGTGTALSVKGGGCEVHGCRFAQADGVARCITFAGKKLVVADSLISAGGIGTYCLHVSGCEDLELRNNVVSFAADKPLISTLTPRATVRLSGNTFATLSGGLFHLYGEGKAGDLATLVADGNIFQVGTSALLLAYNARDVKTWLKWEGANNLYGGKPLMMISDQEPVNRVMGLPAWNTFWDGEESGSREVPEVAFAGQASGGAPVLTPDVRPWRLQAGSPKRADGRAFGADVDNLALLHGAAPAPPAADKEKPFVLVRKGGQREEFKSLSGVLESHKDGDAIEVHGNGPFRVGKVVVAKGGLTLRAAPGYRPTFVPTETVTEVAGAWFEIKDGGLTVEGCDFRPPIGVTLLAGGGGPWELRNCRVLRCYAVADYVGPKLSLGDCLIASQFIGNLGPKCEVELSNNLILTGAGFTLAAPGGQVVLLRDNTVVFCWGDSWMFNLPEAVTARVETTGNLFQWNSGGRWIANVAGPKGSERFRWSGRGNLYGGLATALKLTEGGQVSFADLDGRPWKEPAGKPDLKQVLGRDEDGSRLAADMMDVKFALECPYGVGSEAVIDSLRKATDEARRRPGQAEVGPDWALVGPGEAYVRALAAAGKPVPREALRPEPTADGPFVLLHEKTVRGFLSLQAAADAAADGDVIEVRTDRPKRGCGFKANLGRLTLRAAPGYRPVVEGDVFVDHGSELAVEGLHFRKGGPSGAISRLANCYLEAEGHAPALGCHLREDRPTEIVNCLTLGGVRFRPAEKEGRLTLRNSAVGVIGVAGGPGFEGHTVADLDRCVVWQPIPRWALFYADASHRSTLTATARRTLFEAGGSITNLGWITGWTGSDNCYRVARFWDGLNMNDLAGWRRATKSAEEGSVEADPLLFDPAQWAVKPGSVGHKTAPGGKDFGADVGRVAPVP